MFTTFDDLRDFALSFVDTLVEKDHIASTIDTDDDSEFQIQDLLIQHYIDRHRVDDCLIPNQGHSYCITDINEDYMVAFIESEAIPLGLFTLFIDTFEEDGIDIERLYVSINHTVVYID